MRKAFYSIVEIYSSAVFLYARIPGVVGYSTVHTHTCLNKFTHVIGRNPGLSGNKRNGIYTLIRNCATIILFLVLGMCSSSVFAQTDTLQVPAFFQASMEKLIQKQEEKPGEDVVQIATQTNIPVRETSGIVTVITREDIESSGARDLIDLLRMVPGLDFGLDVQNIVGIGVRGNWAFEGKMLITLDGQMLNETSYGSYAFANRMFLSIIERIEIIRGPGSAIYGGVAGLAVINISTKTGKDLHGFGGVNEIGFANGRSRYSSQLSLGDALSDGLSFNLSAGLSEASLSNKTASTFHGSVINYKDSSQVKSYFLNTGLQYKRLDIRYHYDHYQSDIIENSGRTIMGGHYLNTKYTLPIHSRLTIIPQFLFTRHAPWDLEGVPDNTYNLRNARYTGKIQMVYEPNSHIMLISGVESFYDHSRISVPYSDSVFTNGKKQIGFTNIAFHNQAILKTRIANITLGLRMDDHRAFGAAFAPRLGLTRVMGRWHAKLLYSSAFKAPTIQNIDANSELKPERIYVSEIEAGYQLNPFMSVTANLFNIKIDNTILYVSVDDITDQYSNVSTSGSRGGEIAFQAKYPRGLVRVNYSYYRTIPTEVNAFAVPGEPHLKLGFSAHKMTIQANYTINRLFSLHSTFLLFSKRYAYVAVGREEPELQKHHPALQGNIQMKYNQFMHKGLGLAMGVYNVFNSNYSFIQPYIGHESPVPVQSREVAVKITLALNK